MGDNLVEVYTPVWNGKPINSGWWLIHFDDSPGIREWDGERWRYCGFTSEPDAYQRYPIMRRASASEIRRWGS